MISLEAVDVKAKPVNPRPVEQAVEERVATQRSMRQNEPNFDDAYDNDHLQIPIETPADAAVFVRHVRSVISGYGSRTSRDAKTMIRHTFLSLPKNFYRVAASKSSENNLPPSADDVEERTMKRAFRLCAQNLVGRAVRGCLDAIHVPMSIPVEDVVQKMQDLILRCHRATMTRIPTVLHARSPCETRLASESSAGKSCVR